jgi:hypothetical protein
VSVNLDIQLSDGLSAPARAMDAALGRVEERLDNVGVALRDVHSGSSRLHEELSGMLAPLRSMDAGLARMEQEMRGSASASLRLQGTLARLSDEHVRLQKEMMHEMRLERIAADQRHFHTVHALEDVQKMIAAQRRLNSEMRQSSERRFDPWDGFNSVLGGGLVQNLGRLHPALMAVGTITKFAAEAFFGLSVASFAALGGFAKLAIGHTEFKRNTLSQLELMEGSTSGATRQFSFMREIADRTPFEMEHVIPSIMRFRQTGMGNDDIRRLFFAISDAAGTDVFKANTMVEQLLQMRSRGKVTQEDLKPILSASGMNAEDIVGRGGSMQGMSYEEFLSRFTHAINRVKDKGQGLGTQMDILGFGSLSGQFSTLKSRFGELFSDVNLEPLTRFLRNLNGLLDENNATARELKQTFNEVFDETIGAFFKEYLGKDGIGRLKDDIRDVIPQVKEFAASMMHMAGAVVTLAEVLPEVISNIRFLGGVVAHPIEFGKVALGEITGSGAKRSSYSAVFGKYFTEAGIQTGEWRNRGGRVIDDATGSELIFHQMPGESRRRIVPKSEADAAFWSRELPFLKQLDEMGVSEKERSARMSLLEPNATGGEVIGIANGQAVIAAPGEGLASVGPGEVIQPAGAGRNVTNHYEIHVHTGNTTDDGESIGERVAQAIMELLDGALLQAGVIP